MAISRFSTSRVGAGLPKYQKLWDGTTALSNVGQLTYESIATVSVGSGGSTYIDFTSIPSTYKHLQIRYIARDTTNDGAGIYWQYNADTAANYNRHLIRGNGTAVAASGYSTGQTKAGCGYMLPNSANVFAMGVIDIFDYSNTNKNKTSKMVGGYDNNTSGFYLYSSSLWASTSAISSIKLQCETTFGQYSHFALYGVKG